MLVGGASIVPSCNINNNPIQNTYTTQGNKAKYDNCTPFGIAFLEKVGSFSRVFEREITALSTLSIAVFTVVLAVAGGLQYRAVMASVREARRSSTTQAVLTRKSIAIAERSLIELEAPFLSVAITNNGLVKKTIDGPGHDFETLVFVINNYGRTPAIIFEVAYKSVFISMNDGLPPIIPPDFRCHNTFPGIIAPPNGTTGEKFVENLLAKHMGDLARIKIPLMENELFFYGFIIYKTIFNHKFRKGFSFRFNRYQDQWELCGDDGHNYLRPEPAA
jgi:hypothetical protein